MRTNEDPPNRVATMHKNHETSITLFKCTNSDREYAKNSIATVKQVA